MPINENTARLHENQQGIGLDGRRGVKARFPVDKNINNLIGVLLFQPHMPRLINDVGTKHIFVRIRTWITVFFLAVQALIICCIFHDHAAKQMLDSQKSDRK